MIRYYVDASACIVSILLASAVTHAAESALEVLPVQGNVFMIAGPGGNTAVQVGHEAVVVVDTQTAAVSEQLLATIAQLSAEPIRHIVNTSGDPHHTGGNAALSQAGTYVRLLSSIDPRGDSYNASIFAHLNVLMRMSGVTAQPPVPSDLWPTDTFFTDRWEFFVNNEAIRLLHVPNAYTDGDTIAFFRRSDVISAGHIFNSDRYPAIDLEHGGGIDGIIEGLNLIVDLTVAGENQEGGTVVIPGHGRLGDETDVANYRDMATIVRDRVQALIDDGASLAQVQAARPTLDYDGIYGGTQGGWTGEMFIEAIYRDLSGHEQ